MMNERVYNFAAGPAVLPLPVLKKAQEELLCLPGAGASILEISHRSKTFDAIINGAQENIRKLYNIPENYKILLMQGGALTHFAMVPMNILRNSGKKADYIVTGTWSKKASGEAKTQGEVNVVWDGKAESNFTRDPLPSEYKIDADAKYVYFTSNETIEGVQWPTEPESNGLPLVCDSSSDVFSRPGDINRYGVLFACAQKNAGPAGVTMIIIRDDLLECSGDDLPTMFNYKKQAAGNSMVNTPPCFAIYMLKLVTEWLLNDIGGLEAMKKLNEEKAAILYEVIDASDGFYKGHAAKEYRSMMNVPFRLPSEELDNKFKAEAQEVGLSTLGGHRSVGGLRASIYNAMPKAGVEKLAAFMEDFRKKNA